MRLKVIYFYCIIAISFFKIHAQNEEHLNFILVMDNEIIDGSTIFNGYLETIDNPDLKINFDYETGEITLNSDDYHKFISLNSNTRIRFRFDYFSFDKNKKNNYDIETVVFWIHQRYSIMKIFNFDKKENKKVFGKKEGYGVEFFIPSRSQTLPRRKRIRAKDLLKVN